MKKVKENDLIFFVQIFDERNKKKLIYGTGLDDWVKITSVFLLTQKRQKRKKRYISSYQLNYSKKVHQKYRKFCLSQKKSEQQKKDSDARLSETEKKIIPLEWMFILLSNLLS